MSEYQLIRETFGRMTKVPSGLFRPGGVVRVPVHRSESFRASYGMAHTNSTVEFRNIVESGSKARIVGTLDKTSVVVYGSGV